MSTIQLRVALFSRRSAGREHRTIEFEPTTMLSEGQIVAEPAGVFVTRRDGQTRFPLKVRRSTLTGSQLVEAFGLHPSGIFETPHGTFFIRGAEKLEWAS